MNLRAIEYHHFHTPVIKKFNPNDYITKGINNPTPRGSGKTTKLKNIIDQYGTEDDNILVIVPQISLCSPYTKLEEMKKCIILINNPWHLDHFNPYIFNNKRFLTDEIQDVQDLINYLPEANYIGGFYTPLS